MNFDIEQLLSNPNDLQRRAALVVLFPLLFVIVVAQEAASLVPEVVDEFVEIWKAPIQ